MAIQRETELHSNPRLNITIKSDSQYAVKCMNEYIGKWDRKGWRNSRGDPVANQDLIREASRLGDELKELGRVRYVWVPRTQNELADKHCNEELDTMENEGG
jgi:ribonuclease HI